MTIDHEAPDYLWQQLADLLRRQVADGTLPPRTAVPSLTQLAAQHNVAVVTVQKAIRTLVAEGLLVTRPGRGTYVA